MLVQSVSQRPYAPSRPQQDQGPRLMVGVPTGFLSPEIPPPSDWAVNVGVEIAPGLGISLDGRAILVGHQNTSGNQEIIGHLEDGTYPQRDFKVNHHGDGSCVDGLYNWQDYHLQQNGNTLEVTGETDRESFHSEPTASGFEVISKYSGRTYDVSFQGNVASAKCAADIGRSYTITQNGNVTFVDGGDEQINFTLTRQQDGSIAVDGKLNPQDFQITRNGEAVDVKGYYPQQHYVIRPAA